MSLTVSPVAPIPEDVRSLVEEMLPPTHLLRVIGDHLADLVCDEDFADLYHPTQGQEGLSPAMLAMVTLLQYMENLGDRQAALMVVVRLDWKYALHLPLNYGGFAHSALWEFRRRLQRHGAWARVFEKLLEKLKALGLVKDRGRQRTDTFAVLSAVRRLNRLELVYETLRLALCALEKANLAWLGEQVPLSWADRYAERGYQDRLVREEGEEGRRKSQELARRIGEDGLALLMKLDEPGAPPPLRALPEVETLRTVWAQQYVIREGLVEFPEKRQVDSSEAIATPHDPEARYASKRSTEWEGYKVRVTETAEEGLPHLITDVATVTAPTSEFGMAEEVQERLKGKGLSVSEHLVDSAFVTGEALAASERAGTALLGPARADSSPQSRMEGGITADQFEIDREKCQARCPAGAVSNEWRNRQENGKPVVHVGFDGAICKECVLHDRCVASKNPLAGRTLNIKEHWELVLQRRREQRTQEFKERCWPRAGVEGTLSEMARAHGLRKARYRGLLRVHLQHLMTAAATNLKRAARWLAGKKREGTRSRGLRGLAAATVS